MGKLKSFNCPFAPGTGNAPPLLAGRDAETALLTEALDRLQGPRVAAGQRLRRDPLPPIRICGPRGVGKTVLLFWSKQRAEERGIYDEALAYLKQAPAGEGELHDTADTFAIWLERNRPELHREITAPGSACAKALKRGRQAFDALVRAIVAREPLLLTLDEVHHYDLAPLRELLHACEKIIAEGYPLAVVMAATPGLDRHLNKASPGFVDRSEGLYINLLSDEAARDAMRVPFEQEGFVVQPEALEAMATQADRYPYFTQLMGEAVWYAADKAGVKNIDAGLVAQVAEKVRTKQNYLHANSHEMLRIKGLVPHASQVVELLERGGGVASPEEVFEILAQPGDERAGDPEEILIGLQLDGLIWTEGGETRTGRPSLFEYFKLREEQIRRFT